ncbi:MAG: glycosyltransferase [Bacteroidota bacterium]
MKKILLVLEIDLSLNNGAGINERELVVALLDQFADHITIIAPTPQQPDVFFDNRICYISNHRRHNFFYYLRFLFFTWLQIRKFVNEQKIEAIVFRLGLWPILPILANRKSIPVFLKTFSGYAMFERTDRRLLFKFISNFLWPFYKKAVKLSSAIDTPSHALSFWAVHRFNFEKDNILVIPNGANIRDFQPNNVSEVAARYGYDHFQHIIGYVGAMDSIRFLDEAISAMTYLKNDLSVGLVLVGKGPYLDSLKKLAIDLDLSDNVFFLGFQPYKDIPEIINSFDVAIDLTRVALRIDGNEIIGSYSQKIPQYLACGVPVLAHSCMDTFFIEMNGLGVTIPDSTPQKIATAVRTIILDIQNNKYKKDNIRKYAVENLSYSAIAEKRFKFWQTMD